MPGKNNDEAAIIKSLPDDMAGNIFKSIPHPFYVIDADNHDLIISKPAENFHTSLTNEKCYSFFYNRQNPCYLNGKNCILEEVKNAKKSRKKAYSHHDESGHLTLYEIHAHPVFGDKSHVSHVILNYFNVTELKHCQEMLSKNEEIYRTLVQSIQGYLYSIRYNGRKKPQIYHSPQCEQITGYRPEEYFHDPDLWIKMVHPADVELVSGFFRKLMAKGESNRLEHRIIHKKGHLIWVLNQCTVTVNERGETIRADGVILDITDKKRAEEFLVNSEKMYRNIIATTMEGYCRFDSNYKITETNGAMVKMLGLGKEEIERKNISILVSDESKPFFLDTMMQLKEEGQINFEINLKSREGKALTTLVSATALSHSHADFSGGFAFFTDITERRDIERALMAAKEKAEEATEMKDKFVSLVAHDLKGPLTSIWGYLQILHENASQNTPQKNYITEAMSSCQDMTTLINEILSLSRLKSGHLTPKKSFLDAGKLIENIIHHFADRARQKGIDVINAIPEKRRIYADEKLFYEVMRNLASNAIKFSSKDNSITFFTPPTEPATIALSDTGTGVPAEYMEKIFKYEEKTSMKGTENESGTGLGLPLSRDIMLAHGGDLLVESTPGKGSTFYAKLPEVLPKILIVEDEKAVAQSIRGLLSTLDMEVEIAPGVAEAQALINASPPHLILLDIIMPEISGFKLLEYVMSDPDTRNIPVIIITGDPDMESKNRAFQMGASDFVSKPFQKEDLLPRVKRFTL